MRFIQDMFVIPDEEKSGEYFIYAPLAGSVLSVNSGFIGEMQEFQKGNSKLSPLVKETLQKKGILVANNFKERIPRQNPSEYKPTGVTLMPTWDCNLRCVYCYSNAGENTRGIQMSEEVAKASADWIFQNAVEQNTTSARLSLHGGGEPTLHSNMPLIREVTAYAKKLSRDTGIDLSLSTATNGLTKRTDLEWLVDQGYSFNISLDGLPSVQDKQRPRANGKGSFWKVFETIQYLESKGISYGVRSTISKESVAEMVPFIETLSQMCNIKRMHLEPLFECGRCENTGASTPNSKEFLKNMIKAKQKGKEIGVKIYCSGGELERTTDRFCGAAGSNFFVTPKGDITTCLEVSRPTDDMVNTFLIGKYNPDSKQFDIDEGRLETLRNRTVHNIPKCAEGCFAKYSCAGDCLAKVLAVTGDMHNVEGNPRCEINQGLLLHEMREKVKRDKNEK